MSSITRGFYGFKLRALEKIKTESEIVKHTSECVTYKMSKEEIDRYLESKNYVGKR